MATSADHLIQTTLADINPGFPVREEIPVMHARKRNGALEPVDVNKIVRAVQGSCHGLSHVDAIRVASKTIGGLYDGATTRELDTISIDTAASLIAEEPQYSRLAARLLLAAIVKEVSALNLHSFSQAIAYGHQEGVVSKATVEFVQTHARKLNHAIDDSLSDRFEYFGLRTVYDRYLLRDPLSRSIIETPQHFFLRVSCGLAMTPHEAIEFYRLIASLDYMPSSPTLFNSGTKHAQMSSCYLHDSPLDSLESIYDTYKTSRCSRSFRAASGWRFIACAPKTH
jgi:ribonucleoside-diphosphate reductase alpha chain